MKIGETARVLAVVAFGTVLIASLGFNLYLSAQDDSLSKQNSTLSSEVRMLGSQGTTVINGSVYDVTALGLNFSTHHLAADTVVLFRNMIFTYVPNNSNGTQWEEFQVLPIANHGMPQDLKAYFWPLDSFTQGSNEAFGFDRSVGVMMKPNDTSYVYLLVEVMPTA